MLHTTGKVSSRAKLNLRQFSPRFGCLRLSIFAAGGKMQRGIQGGNLSQRRRQYQIVSLQDAFPHVQYQIVTLLDNYITKQFNCNTIVSLQEAFPHVQYQIVTLPDSYITNSLTVTQQLASNMHFHTYNTRLLHYRTVTLPTV